MSTSIRISELNPLSVITADDYFPLVDSGSRTTYRADFNAVLSFLSISGSCVSASYAISSSHAISSSYAISASHALASDTSISASYAATATSASYASNGNSISASSAVSSSYALTSTSASHALWADTASTIMLDQTVGPYYQYLTMWSGSYSGILDRTNIIDLGVQYNVGKLMFFQHQPPVTSTNYPGETYLKPIPRVYKELRTGSVYNQWITTCYVYSSGSGDDVVGAYADSNNPEFNPREQANANLRFIPRVPDAGRPPNILDEQGIGSQLWTQYFRSQRYWSWYLGGSFMGHSNDYLTPGISASVVMTLATPGRLGIGNFYSGSPSLSNVPQKPLHISGSDNAYNDSAVSLVRLDQKVGSAGSIGSLVGWFKINISGSDYNVPLYQ